jgi:5-methylcytosine-specific restriction enzyme B
MNYSDAVRNYCLKTYIEPARRKREKYAVIRSGDIHDALSFRNKHPLVCSALGSNKFEEMAQVKRVSIDGPLNGANTIFKFDLF